MTAEPFDPPPLILTDDPDRPPGLHVSQIYSSIMQHIDKKRYDPDADLPLLKITAGLAMEQALAKVIYALSPGSFRPQAVKKDGIWVSPDNVALDPWRGREFKLTWYSMKKECPWHDVFWPWRVQMMAYAWVLETLIFELWVLFINGAYPYGAPSPVLQPYLLTFSEQELYDNWQMILAHAKWKGWLK